MNRTVLVTGGARGIGAAIAEQLRTQGCTVLTPPRADLNLADVSSVESFLAREGQIPVDVMVNNAGINILSSIETLEPAALQTMIQVNLASAVRLSQAYVSGMRARGWGRILCLSSIFGLVTKEQRAAYSVSKAALSAFSRSLTVEYARFGILSNTLCPGYVDTALTRQNNSPEQIEAIIATIPARRLAQVDEIARVACFLCSEENTYISGQDIVVDGGFLCQ